MLQCSGVVAIPSRPKLQFTPWNDQGFFMSFSVVSQEPVKNKNTHKIHYYQVNIYIARERRNHWESVIKPGQVFHIKTGDFSSVIPEGYSNPISQVKIREYNFLHLKQPVWHK